MDLELISFKLCPFVQRAVITLLHREVPHRITFIDLDDPPEWFLEISPFGKVPVLRVDGKHVLFESAVINEFVDEAMSGAPMQPRDPLQRALNRAWIEFGSACLGDSHDLMTAPDEAGYEAARKGLHDKFDKLETILKGGPYFNGEHFSLVDTSYAPLFMRLDILHDVCHVYGEDEFPRIVAWSRVLAGLEAVRNSVVPDFQALYLDYVRSKGGYLAELLAGRG